MRSRTGSGCHGPDSTSKVGDGERKIKREGMTAGWRGQTEAVSAREEVGEGVD